MSKTSGSDKGSPSFSKQMKAVGKGMARANQQKASKKAPMADSTGGGSKPYGGGQSRTTSFQTRGKDWKGVT